MLLDEMAAELGLPPQAIRTIAKRASHLYKRYHIEKRSGGLREINHPARQLKALQRWLVLRVIGRLPVHECATAYSPSASIRRNASAHANSRFLLRMDFHEFFPSIQADAIASYLRSPPAAETIGLNDADIELFCSLVCRHGRLTIGAPTSPGLSNAICFGLDSELSALGVRAKCAYTRYADDLFFSTTQPNVLRTVEQQVEAVLPTIPWPRLSLNKQKTRHSSKKVCRRVTGVVITPNGMLSLGREFKRRVRSLVFRFPTLDEDGRKNLQGLLGHAQGVEPEFINRLILKFGVERVAQARRGGGSAGA